MASRWDLGCSATRRWSPARRSPWLFGRGRRACPRRPRSPPRLISARGGGPTLRCPPAFRASRGVPRSWTQPRAGSSRIRPRVPVARSIAAPMIRTRGARTSPGVSAGAASKSRAILQPSGPSFTALRCASAAASVAGSPGERSARAAVIAAATVGSAIVQPSGRARVPRARASVRSSIVYFVFFSLVSSCWPSHSPCPRWSRRDAPLRRRAPIARVSRALVGVAIPPARRSRRPSPWRRWRCTTRASSSPRPMGATGPAGIARRRGPTLARARRRRASSPTPRPPRWPSSGTRPCRRSWAACARSIESSITPRSDSR